MRAIVVYKSIYGNTREVAEASPRDSGDIRAVSVQEAVSSVSKADLLVVGGPIHVHGLTSKRSRTAAVDNAQRDVVPGAGDGPGLRDWLADLPRVANAQAAAFDTRASGSHLLTGAASHGIARRLRGPGYKLLETESFVVKSTVGPLPDCELQRAVTRARSSPTRYPPFTTRPVDGVWWVARLPQGRTRLCLPQSC